MFGKRFVFAATWTSSSGALRSGGSFGFSTLGSYVSGHLNSASEGERKGGKKKKMKKR